MHRLFIFDVFVLSLFIPHLSFFSTSAKLLFVTPQFEKTVTRSAEAYFVNRPRFDFSVWALRLPFFDISILCFDLCVSLCSKMRKICRVKTPLKRHFDSVNERNHLTKLNAYKRFFIKRHELE